MRELLDCDDMIYNRFSAVFPISLPRATYTDNMCTVYYVYTGAVTFFLHIFNTVKLETRPFATPPYVAGIL